jgi:hypothetical protein
MLAVLPEIGAISQDRCFRGIHRLKFFSVTSLRSLPYPTVYDLILSAETLYNLEAVHKVYEFLSGHLSESGIALIASKR